MRTLSRKVSMIVGVSVLGWVSAARAAIESCTVCGGEDPYGFAETCCVTSSSVDGGNMDLPAQSTPYSEGFESGFSWLNWENCATDNNYYAIQYYDGNDNPIDGNYAMRLHTGGLSQSCLFPGMYALSDTVHVYAGYPYTFSAYTRNASNTVLMTALFYDVNGILLEVVDDYVSADAWTWHGTSMKLHAPANAAFAQVRFGLQTANEYTDVDDASIVYSP